MNDLAFLKDEWLWPVILISIILWIIFVWKEWSNYPKRAFYINIAIALIAILSLVCIVLKPLKISTGDPFKAVIVTNNYNEGQLDSLKQTYVNLKVIPYKEGESIFERSGNPEAVFVIGDGIKSYDLWQLDSIDANYLGGITPKGIIKLNYDPHNFIGKNILIQGQYQKAIKGSKLLLEEPGGRTIDSVLLTSKDTLDFKLSANLKVAGRSIYNIVEKDSVGTIISRDPLPISVTNEDRLSILIINEFPTFESKYLKNYLAAKGHRVVVRSQLTKDSYKYEYFNSDNRPTIGFNRKDLEFFDLLIIDATSLNNLSRRNRSAVQQSVTEDGLGVFIQPDTNFFNSNSRLVSFAFQKSKLTSSALMNWPRIEINTFPYNFRSDFALQPIQRSKTKLLSAYKRLGLGRIGTTTVLNSYELLLNGHQEVYQDLWSKMLENIAKKKTTRVEWSRTPLLAFDQEPFEFKVRTQIETPMVSTNEGNIIPLKQDIHLSSIWNGKTYPREVGWKQHVVQQDSSAVFDYYVIDDSHWKSLVSHATGSENKRYFNNNDLITKKTNRVSIPINLTWFYLVFVLSIGYLWLAPKL